jgi:hypothetical protein
MTKVWIEPHRKGGGGYRYRIKLGDRVLMESSRVPTYDACRALLALGITGRLEVWRPGSAHPAMLVPDIERAAGYTVIENEKIGPVLGKYSPFGLDGVSRASGSAPAAELVFEPPTPPPTQTAVLEGTQ